jgi:hypothetical protein
MSDQHSINVRTVEAYMAQRTDDGTQMGLVLRLATGMEGFAFSHKDFALFAAKLLQTAVTESQLPSPVQDSPVHTAALPVSAISFASDASEPSAVEMVCDLGPLRLALVLEATTLFKSLKSFMDGRRTQASNKQFQPR